MYELFSVLIVENPKCQKNKTSHFQQKILLKRMFNYQ